MDTISANLLAPVAGVTVPVPDMSTTKTINLLDPGTVVNANAASNQEGIPLGPRELSPEPTGDVNYYQPEYSFAESMVAGFQTTAISYAYSYLDQPDFTPMSGYDARLQLEDDERNYGIIRTAEEKAFLLLSNSDEEFNWRLEVQHEERNDAKRAAQNPAAYLAGSLPDLDLAIGYGVGKVNTLNKLSTIPRIGANAAITGGVTGAAYGLGSEVKPLSTSDLIINTVGVAAGSLLGDLARSKPKHTPLNVGE
jgi:hypothetical protein